MTESPRSDELSYAKVAQNNNSGAITMMQLYTNPQSRGNIILPFLKELKIEDQVELINISYEDMHQATYLAINPMAKVPCLKDGDIVVTEVPAIIAYLADKYIEQDFAPALNDPKRGAYLKWLFYIHGPLTEYMDIKNLNVADDLIESKKMGLSFGDEQRLFQFLKQGLSQAKPYLLGEKCTAADLYLAYWLVYAMSFKLIPYFEEAKPFLRQMKTRASLQGIAWFDAFE